MQGPWGGKRLLGQGLVDLALILAALRQSDITDLSYVGNGVPSDETSRQDLFSEVGPLIGISTSSMHHFQEQSWLGGSGYSQKSANLHYDNIMDEYENIMRDIRSRPPILSTVSELNTSDDTDGNTSLPQSRGSGGRNFIAMVISVTTTNVESYRGGQSGSQGGAVGGVEISRSSYDYNLDLFGNYTPTNMGEEQIENLMLSSQVNESSSNVSEYGYLPDNQWHQFLSGYNSSFGNYQGSLACSCAAGDMFGNFHNRDIVDEAILSTDLFGNPTLLGGRNDSHSHDSSSVNTLLGFDLDNDVVSSSRLEMIDSHEWSTQNHEEDILFPTLTPPTYEEVMAAQESNLSSNSQNDQDQCINHMHDHNYFNNSSTVDVASRVQERTSYAIRSRHEVTTRVITVPPRHTSAAYQSTSAITEVFDSNDAASDTSSLDIQRTSVRRITTGSDSGVEMETDIQVTTQESQVDSDNYSFNDFEIFSLNSTLYENLSKDVGRHREVILCN